MTHFFADPEEQLAGLFEILVERQLGITPGARTRKDVTDGSDLRVDFVYDSATPDPLALEITTLPLEELPAAADAGDRWLEDLDHRVRTESLGNWVVHFSAQSNTRDLSDDILEVLQSRPEEDEYTDPAGRYTLMRRNQPGDDEANGVYFLGVSTTALSVTGFSRELRDAAVSNAKTLEEARPRQTHLMVLVGLHKSLDPALTLVPPSSDQEPGLAGIDWIWVTFHTRPEGFPYRKWVWWARPGDDEWNTHEGGL